LYPTALCLTLGWFAAATSVRADDPTPKSDDVKPARVEITRADLAAAYLRLEQAYFANQPGGELRANVNRTFDAATLAFFTGRNGDAVRMIDGTTETLLAMPTAPADVALTSLKITVEPPVWRVGQVESATVRLQSLYEPKLAQPVEASATLRLISPEGKTVSEQAVPLTLGPGHAIDTQIKLTSDGRPLAAGVYRVVLGSESRPRAAARVCVVSGETLEVQRAANAGRLDGIKATPDLADALATARARNGLLSDRPSETNSAQFLADLDALARDVRQEIDALAAGKNPYTRRPGDLWRVFPTKGGTVPLRVFAPPQATGDNPAPLLIVLHGMGGDENMFFEGYGLGMIRQIAADQGLLVAAPLTYRFGSNPENFDALVDQLSRDYAVDRQRIYVLGHSLGAGATAGLARSRAEQIAAACCVAGGSFPSSPNWAPTLAVIAELDAVVPGKPLEAAVQKGASAGAPLEARVMAGYGHTLVVGATLADCVDWLLGHRLTGAK